MAANRDGTLQIVGTRSVRVVRAHTRSSILTVRQAQLILATPSALELTRVGHCCGQRIIRSFPINPALDYLHYHFAYRARFDFNR